MAGTWTEGLEKALLLALLDPSSNYSKAHFDEASKKIGGPGGNACRQRFYKLRKEAEALTTGDGDPPVTPSTKVTSTKTVRSKKSTSTRKRKHAEARAEDDDDDDEEDQQTPSKKGRKTQIKVEMEIEPATSDVKGADHAVYEAADAEAIDAENEIA